MNVTGSRKTKRGSVNMVSTVNQTTVGDNGKEPIRVISLMDGMGGTALAMKKLGFKARL